MSRPKSPFESAEFYNQVYAILVEYTGAIETEQANFVSHFTSSYIPIEWRFQGRLGFGGKFWRNDGRIYVNCYPEDRTPIRAALIEETNETLGELVQRFISEQPKT